LKIINEVCELLSTLPLRPASFQVLNLLMGVVTNSPLQVIAN
jgi:hypothetical protein